MSLEEETYFDSDSGAHLTTPDISQRPQLSDGDCESICLVHPLTEILAN